MTCSALSASTAGDFTSPAWGKKNVRSANRTTKNKATAATARQPKATAGRNPPAVPAAATMLGEGVSPAASATANGSPPGSAAATA